MAKIISVRTSVKEDKTLGVFQVEGKEKPIFLTDKQIASATGLTRNFSILKGADISVEYHKVGDKLHNGTECTKENTLIKEFSIELPDRLNNIAAASAFGASMF